MKENKKLLITVASLLVVVLSVTLAYFTARIIGEGKSISVKNANLQIIFTDGTDGSISGTNIEPGWKDSKTFSVTNKSNETYKYNIIIQNLVNTFITEDYLKYKITSTDGGYNMSEYKSVPKSSEATDMLLSEEVSIEIGKTHNYTVEFVYDNDENFDQSVDMNKTLTGTIFIDKSTTLYDKLLFDNPTIKTRTDFSVAFTETNVNTLYKATEQIGSDTAKDVYYFAGDAENNWVKFGRYSIGACYNEQYADFNFPYVSDISNFPNSIMEPTREQCTSGKVCKIQLLENNSIVQNDMFLVDNEESCTALTNKITQLVQSNGTEVIGTYTYLNTEYEEQDSKEFYWRIIRTNHDGSIRLLYHGDSPESTEAYIGETLFNEESGDQTLGGYMYGDTASIEGSRANTIDSTIKSYIDGWYQIYFTNYTKYLSNDAVYCNERGIGQTTFDSFSTNRITEGNPTYNCTNTSDAFSVNNTEAKLTYPVGLVTADEVLYAGGKYKSESKNWMYYNSLKTSSVGTTNWWTMTYSTNTATDGWSYNYIVANNIFNLTSSNYLYEASIIINSETTKVVARPVTSLKSCVKLRSGDGSASNPYTILETETGC